MWLIYDWNHLIGLAKLNDIGPEQILRKYQPVFTEPVLHEEKS